MIVIILVDTRIGPEFLYLATFTAAFSIKVFSSSQQCISPTYIKVFFPKSPAINLESFDIILLIHILRKCWGLFVVEWLAHGVYVIRAGSLLQFLSRMYSLLSCYKPLDFPQEQGCRARLQYAAKLDNIAVF
jgi:hypothetical protein